MPTKKKVETEVAVVETKSTEVSVSGVTPMDNIDLGMLDLGTKLKINKKGNFVGAEVEGIDLGDEIVGAIVETTFEFSLWRDEKVEGKLDDDVEKLLIVANRPDVAEAEFDRLDDELGLTDLGYTHKHIKGKVILTVETEDGTLYVVRTNPTGLIQFQKYASAIINGVFKNKKYPTETKFGVQNKGRLGLVKTRLYTGEIKRGSFDVVTILFEFVGDLDA